jgi:hypothetical protein
MRRHPSRELAGLGFVPASHAGIIEVGPTNILRLPKSSTFYVDGLQVAVHDAFLMRRERAIATFALI